MSEVGKRRLIGITGGIGAGKSVVSRILRLKGFDVYDCDSRASEIMHASEEILEWLRCNAGQEAVDARGIINRRHLAKVIFGDADKRDRLNQLVHSAVREDVRNALSETDDGVMFVESAILATSHLDMLCDEVWVVDAPEEMRVERVCRRSGISPEEVRERMAVQTREIEAISAPRVAWIDNGGASSLLVQIDGLLSGIN